ncbi:MAG: 2-hydroxyacyl-CoA dehydratase family protein [Candidatus Marinimicrobia bacterium]|nr:2-hydroxyacyl-CoA dehydratase family protein [Candidatus Neomarinimicrobiota bacterium]
MSLSAKLKYKFMKDYGAPALMSLQGLKRRRSRPTPSAFGPPLESNARLKEILTRHYYLSRFVPGVKKVAWVTSGAPVELLRVFDFYTIYPENHSALVGAKKQGAEYCGIAEGDSFSQDLCSYARIDLGHMLSGKSPAGKLPKPDLLFCSNNICQTVLYWYKAISQELDIPLIHFDAPFVSDRQSEADIRYMAQQLQDMIPILEQVSGNVFYMSDLEAVLKRSQDSSRTWGNILKAMQAKPAPMTIFDAFGHLAPIVSLRGLPVAQDYYNILAEEIDDRVSKGIGAIRDEKYRLIWDNIAIWYKVRYLATFFAERKMNFVTATYTNAWAETIDHLNIKDPWNSMARTYGQIILNNNLKHRLGLMRRMIDDFSVDGMVMHSTRSCKPYSVGQYDLRKAISTSLNLPSVIIDADIADERVWSEQQIQTRLEAFCESLEDTNRG